MATGSSGRSCLAGLPPTPLRALLARRLGNQAAQGAVDLVTQRGRPLKSALVPGADLDWWRELLAFSLFGRSCVQDRWPYLGAVCATRQPLAQGGLHRISPEMLHALRAGTRGKAFAKLGPRARGILSTRGSAGRRAQLWSTYVSSLSPYPAHVISMDSDLERVARTHFADALGLGRAGFTHQCLSASDRCFRSLEPPPASSLLLIA